MDVTKQTCDKNQGDAGNHDANRRKSDKNQGDAVNHDANRRKSDKNQGDAGNHDANRRKSDKNQGDPENHDANRRKSDKNQGETGNHDANRRKSDKNQDDIGNHDANRQISDKNQGETGNHDANRRKSDKNQGDAGNHDANRRKSDKNQGDTGNHDANRRKSDKNQGDAVNHDANRRKSDKNQGETVNLDAPHPVNYHKTQLEQNRSLQKEESQVNTSNKTKTEAHTEPNWLVGKGVPKIDGIEKVNGDIEYVEDIILPRMLYGAILRSPHAHALIKNIDASKALALDGVKAVITAEDTPKIKFSFNIDQSDNLVLCDDKVRFIGDEVAAVACDTPELAQKALDLIEVEYEPLPGIYTTDEAMKEDALRLHELRPGNVSAEKYKDTGDVDEAFLHCAHIFEDVYTTSKQAHAPLERRGCIVRYDQNGHYTVWSPTQTPHKLRPEMAHVLGEDVANITIKRMPVGGGFGNRLVMDMKEPVAAFLAKKTKRPVQIVNTRKEEFETSRTRYPYSFTIKLGLDEEGKILARHVKAIVDTGAYGDKGPNTMNLCMGVNEVMYNVPNTRFEGLIIYTNNQPGTGFRGFGNPQITFAIESQMDDVAERLNIDPLEFRRRNANIQGQVTSGGKLIDTFSMPETLNIATERSDYLKKWTSYAKQPKDAKKRRGIGMACIGQTGGSTRGYGFNSVDAFIKVSEVGEVTVITSGVEMGQGSQTVMAQIAGEVLGITMDRIKIVDYDTTIIPYDLGSWGSRTTFVNGVAVKHAAEDAKQELMGVAADKFSLPKESLILKDGKIGPENDWTSAVAVSEIVRFATKYMGRTISGRGRYYDEEAPVFARGEGSHAFPTLIYACQVAEVEVDMETGQVEILKITAVHDVGRAINPVGVYGQLEGGIVQGIGYAITEGLMQHEGRALNPSFLDYKILSAPDVPEMDIQLVEDSHNPGPFGAKGVGEQGIIPPAAAIGNALKNALGSRISALPFKPEAIMKHTGGLS